MAPPNGALLRWPFERAGNTVSIDVQGPITLDKPRLVRIVAQDGIGLGHVMQADVREDMAAGRLVRDLDAGLAPLALYYGPEEPAGGLHRLPPDGALFSEGRREKGEGRRAKGEGRREMKGDIADD